MSFAQIQALIESEDPRALGDALIALSADERKAYAKDLVAYEKEHRRGDRRWDDGEQLSIAGAGLLPNASALAPWLLRYPIFLHHDFESDARVLTLIEVLRQRALSWMPDLIARLTVKIPSRERWRQDLSRLIVEFCGDEPPRTDGFLLHLMDFGVPQWKSAYDPLLPRMLEAVGAGVVLGVERRGWVEFLVRQTDRQAVLDVCLARLQQGGTAGEMDGFLGLHAALKVTQDETLAHARDYLAMLPDSRSTVAGLAQERLRSLDEAGNLDFDLLLDASRWVFGRTEKKLVRAQLTWLGKHAEARPDEVVLTLAELFAHESADLRGQAVKLIVKHLGNASDETQASVRALAEQLPDDLARELGVSAEQDSGAELVAFESRPFPALIATLDELTGELMAAVGRDRLEPSTAERIVEAIVRFAWQDREALAAALQPVFDKHAWLGYREQHPGWNDDGACNPRSEFFEIVLAARAKPKKLKKPVSETIDLARNWRTTQEGNGEIADRLARRLHEIAKGLVHLPKPALVSTPTEASGLIDPAVLKERLARAEAEGWQPWPRDLRQALERLPSFESEAVIALAERTFAYEGYDIKDTGLYATVTPGLEEPENQLRHWDESGPMMEWWPSLLPTRPDVVAAHLVPHLRARTGTKGGDGPLLPMLAESHGPAGPATHLALTYGLGAELTLNRAYAVDAILLLAARDQLDGALLGDLAGQVLERGDVVLNRVLPGLRDAARSGAAPQVWAALTAMLPRLWAHNRVADVLELAVELAQRLKPGGDVEGLADVAARKGSSKAVVQAKRLVSALGVKA
ncbi:DUF6493 family protein [Lentzea sp. NBRC 102530]|uniref:DUF7824 domain-containing protein n=1 Tax=Lentzea sp. NBRC 102530 TaxID=3032201 RepID=UPI0024A0AD28|nr:DUF6493 family protein [Lentzea sp. NBRC 102530]GLY51131.1 hypothetical protein Lesp01_47870 [Lentzea sp. NBRC 102530]